jgi:LacI family transcriptional regulator
MNIKEIAKRAGVSTATVSRAINRIPTVDPHLSRRVWKIVDELGYYPDQQARALVSGQSRIFGLIVPELINPVFPEIVQAFEEIAFQHNYEVLLSSTSHDPQRMELAMRRMVERRVDGVAVLTFGMEECVIANSAPGNIPMTLVDASHQMPGVTNIRVDYQQGIRQAVQHLAALRHSRIAFVAGPPSLKSARAQRHGFEESMRELGLRVPAEFIVIGDNTIEAGMKAVTTLAALEVRPTAVFCSNDLMAIGVLHQASGHGIAIPQELSVVGFDDIRLARFTIPPLTTVQMSQLRLATLAFEALLEKARGDRSVPSNREYLLTTQVVLRSTTMLRPPSHARH